MKHQIDAIRQSCDDVYAVAKGLDEVRGAEGGGPAIGLDSPQMWAALADLVYALNRSIGTGRTSCAEPPEAVLTRVGNTSQTLVQAGGLLRMSQVRACQGEREIGGCDATPLLTSLWALRERVIAVDTTGPSAWGRDREAGWRTLAIVVDAVAVVVCRVQRRGVEHGWAEDPRIEPAYAALRAARHNLLELSIGQWPPAAGQPEVEMRPEAGGQPEIEAARGVKDRQAPEAGADDTTQFDRAEYEVLKREGRDRLRSRGNLVLGAVMAWGLAVVAALYVGAVGALLVVPMVAALLCQLALQHDRVVVEIGRYVHGQLVPRIRGGNPARAGVFGWEDRRPADGRRWPELVAALVVFCVGPGFAVAGFVDSGVYASIARMLVVVDALIIVMIAGQLMWYAGVIRKWKAGEVVAGERREQ